MATKHQLGSDERTRMIAEGAYFRALERGFEGGDPLDDWLSAERDIDARFDIAPHDKKLEQLYVQLAEANDKLRDSVTKIKAGARAEWREEITRIQKLRDTLAEKLDDARDKTGDARQRARRQAEKVWKELVDGLKRIEAYYK